MKTIKTKPKEKTLPMKSRQLPRNFMVKSLRQGKRQIESAAQHEHQETETTYAVDNTTQGLEQGKNATISSINDLSRRGKQIKQLTRTIKEKRLIRTAGKEAATTTAADSAATQATMATKTTQANDAYRAGRQRALRMAQSHRSRQMPVAGRGAMQPKSNAKAAFASPVSGQTIKAARRTVKVGTRDIKTASQAVKASGRSARVVARPAANTAQQMKNAAKATVNATKRAAKAVITSIKAILAAARALIAILSAGGSMVVLIAVATILIVLMFGSAFGIFFSNEADEGKLTEAIIQTQTEFTDMLQSEFDALSSAGTYDSIEVHYGGDFDGDSDMVNNWQDVLAVYAVKTMYADDEVLTVTPEKVQMLKEVFNDMNLVDFSTEVEEIEQEGEGGNTYTTRHLHIHINITSMDYLEGAELYAFTKSMLEVLEEMMSSAYYEYFSKLLDVEMYGGLTGADVLEIVNSLPTGTKGSDIAQAAISKVGTPYSQMDCSQLSAYAYAQAGVSLPRTSVEQAKYCYNNGYVISAAQLQPGDLIFWSKESCKCGRWNEVHHVGIYIGNGQIVDASSKRGRVVLRNMWEGGGYTVLMYARAHV